MGASTRMGRRPILATTTMFVVAVVVTLVAVVAVTTRPPGDGSRAHARSTDSDGDGLTDAAEVQGWPTTAGTVLHSDPHRADTDGDGLPDGVEAGDLVSERRVVPAYAELSDPERADTDGDGVGDADEVLQDLDPRRADTDHDGLDDAAELVCGSDPTAANPDGDRYTDPEECDRGSNPLTYDLTRGQAVAALLGGAGFGEATGAAHRLAGLNEAQTSSPEYLAGQIATSTVGVGAARDAILNLGQGDFVSALIDAGALVPIAGGAAATATILVRFAKRGERAELAAVELAERLPGPTSVKAALLARLTRSRTRLPAELGGGPKTYCVYSSSVDDLERYVGMSVDCSRRAKEHARDGRLFAARPLPGMTGLSRGQALAVEEFCIAKGLGRGLANKKHSIGPSLPYYEPAMRYAERQLAKSGGRCPI